MTDAFVWDQDYNDPLHHMVYYAGPERSNARSEPMSATVYLQDSYCTNQLLQNLKRAQPQYHVPAQSAPAQYAPAQYAPAQYAQYAPARSDLVEVVPQRPKKAKPGLLSQVGGLFNKVL